MIAIENVIEPYPMKRRISLASAFPEIAAFWCYEKNCGFGPDEFSIGSFVSPWWKCVLDERHIFQQSIQQRVRAERNFKVYGHGCPFCASKKVCDTNSLKELFPGIAKDWHPTKNGKLTTETVAAKSFKKVWWTCGECGNNWQAKISNRTTNDSGCPSCANKVASARNNLHDFYPAFAAQWHPKKNGALLPKQVTVSSNKRVWWICKKGADHVWQTTVQARVNYRTGCPFCNGRRVSTTNCLARVRPELAKEWHPTRNGTLTPSDVTKGSSRRVWWQCLTATDHFWEASIADRTKGTGCPFCHRDRVAARSK